MKTDKPSDDEELSKVYKEVGPFLGLGLQLTITVAVMVVAGVWLDSKFNTSPVLTIIFSFLGVAAGLYSFIKTVLKSNK